MLTRIKLPKLAETTDVVVIESWIVDVGAHVDEGAPLVSVETDKVTLEVPSPVAGVVEELLVEPDDEVRTGDPLCTIRANGASR